eukprot:scaffold14036_cov95-Skeletonema_dohrnii-CCMP3373.AAC.5
MKKPPTVGCGPQGSVGRAILVLAVMVVCGNGIVRYNSDGAPASVVGHSRALKLFDANIDGKKDKKVKKEKENAPPPPPPPAVCDSNIIQCGHTSTAGEKLFLLNDLVCSDNPQSGVECAITLSGEGAELNCNDFTVRPATTRSGRWKYGICLYDGAKAMNCHVQRFGVIADNADIYDNAGAGIHVKDGGEIDDCEVMFNINGAQGIMVEGSQDQDSITKISSTYVHHNDNNGILFNPPRADSILQIEKVRSNDNGGDGMHFGGSDATYYWLKVIAKDSETNYNQYTGFSIAGGDTTRNVELELEFEGFFNSRYNGKYGMIFDDFIDLDGEMNVKGVVNLYKNERNGFEIESGLNVVVDVSEGGFLNSCDNDQSGDGFKDIFNDGTGTFSFVGGDWSGDGYACGSAGPPGADLPYCKACPCPDIFPPPSSQPSLVPSESSPPSSHPSLAPSECAQPSTEVCQFKYNLYSSCDPNLYLKCGGVAYVVLQAGSWQKNGRTIATVTGGLTLNLYFGGHLVMEGDKAFQCREYPYVDFCDSFSPFVCDAPYYYENLWSLAWDEVTCEDVVHTNGDIDLSGRNDEFDPENGKHSVFTLNGDLLVKPDGSCLNNAINPEDYFIAQRAVNGCQKCAPGFGFGVNPALPDECTQCPLGTSSEIVEGKSKCVDTI